MKKMLPLLLLLFLLGCAPAEEPWHEFHSKRTAALWEAIGDLERKIDGHHPPLAQRHAFSFSAQIGAEPWSDLEVLRHQVPGLSAVAHVECLVLRSEQRADQPDPSFRLLGFNPTTPLACTCEAISFWEEATLEITAGQPWQDCPQMEGLLAWGELRLEVVEGVPGDHLFVNIEIMTTEERP